MRKLQATISSAGMRIVQLLVGKPPQTVAEMIRATGVTRTAVTEQLNELIGAGFVDRTTQRLPGRGRPRHLYSATDSALLVLFTGNEQMVVPAMWRAIEKIGGPELKERVLEQVSLEVAEHYRRRVNAKSPAERLRQMAKVLREEGHLAEIEEEDGQLVIRKRSCPFISMFEKTRSVCCVDQDVISTVVGAPVEQVNCRHDGDPSCAFQIISSNGE